MAKGLRVFISYAHADVEFALRLRSELESRGVDVWVDEKEILVGDSISQKIEQGLSSCQYFCLVLSKNSLARPWVQREYRTALNIQLSQDGEGVRILPLKTTELPVPPLLQDIRFADFTRGFFSGLNELCLAIGVPTIIAPFVDIISTLKVDPENLKSLYCSAIETQDMNILIPIWRSIVNGAKILNNELPQERVQLVSLNQVEYFLLSQDVDTGILLLPPIEIKENMGGKSDIEYSFSYTITMEGVNELLACLGKWFDAVRSRQIYLAPRYISWDAGWSGSGEKVVLKTRVSISK